jgi:hypothetical protein
MIKLIKQTDLPKGLYKSFVFFVWPFGNRYKDIFFEVQNKENEYAKSPLDFWDFTTSLNNSNLPRGIFALKGIDNKKYLRITYDPKAISDTEVVNWIETIY